MSKPPANYEDFSMVADELAGLLQNDPLLQGPFFKEATAELLDLICTTAPPKDKPLEKNKHLIISFANELLYKIEARYEDIIFSRLNEILIVGGIIPMTRKECFKELHVLTGNLLSMLMDSGASLESLYQLYRQILIKEHPGRPYSFEKRLGLLRNIITQEPQNFRVVFSIDNISDPPSFPAAIGQVNFTTTYQEPISAKPTIKKYLVGNPRRIYAAVDVKTRDVRSAGTLAYGLINNVLDLARFEYERGQANLAEEFLVFTPKSCSIFSIPKVVPNPQKIVANSELQQFVQSINELVGNPKFSTDGRDRIQSAFRLYRIGADTNIFENKLVNWWTAIEFLVKGSSSSGGIGDAVEETLAPVLCLNYINKIIGSLRDSLVDLKVDLLDSKGSPIQLKSLNISELYALFNEVPIRTQLMSLSVDPFFKNNLDEFLSNISSPEKIHSLLKSHERRLRWHIQRLYRARCDIVHSADQLVNAALLCANLEFYLKTTLTALLRALAKTPHIFSSKEFFDRQSRAYAKLLSDLKSGNDIKLVESLS